MLVKLDHFPRDPGWTIQKYLSCHHLGSYWIRSSHPIRVPNDGSKRYPRHKNIQPVDGRNPAPVDINGESTTIYRVLPISVWCRISSINSIICSSLSLHLFRFRNCPPFLPPPDLQPWPGGEVSATQCTKGKSSQYNWYSSNLIKAYSSEPWFKEFLYKSSHLIFTINHFVLRFGRANECNWHFFWDISIHSILNFHPWRVQVAQSLKSKIDSLRVFSWKVMSMALLQLLCRHVGSMHDGSIWVHLGVQIEAIWYNPNTQHFWSADCCAQRRRQGWKVC